MTDNSTWQGLDIRTIVLVGGRDFGRCPLAARLPTALWPIADKLAIVRLLDHLASEGIGRATVCCDASIAQEVTSVCRDSRLAVTVMPDEQIRGTGGCLRDAVFSDPGNLILALSASMVAPPSLGSLIDAHQSSGADMTVAFNPGRSDGEPFGRSAETFLCRPQVLSHIPPGGYSDIKEGVIPAVVRAGGVVRPHVLERPAGNFRDRQEYLEAIATLLHRGGLDRLGLPLCERTQGGPVFQGADALVHPDARICGPILIGDHAKVREGAVVIGPAIIGRNVIVGENSVVVRSVLWAGAFVGSRCEIRESILDCRAGVPDDTAVVGCALPAFISGDPQEGEIPSPHGPTHRVGKRVKSYLDHYAGGSAGGAGRSRGYAIAVLAGLAVVVALLWSYRPTISDMIGVWRRSDEYSSGMLVPFLAAYVIWLRRKEIGSARLRPALLWGTAAVLATQVCRILGLYYNYQSGLRLSLVLTVAALALLMTGWQGLKRLWSVLLFLCLMLPWPNRVQTAIAQPLQQWATRSAVFCLDLGGWGVIRNGNTIDIEGVRVEVAYACNGLRMITAFFVISGLVALLTRRAWWEKLIVLLSSLPIALLCNTLRLVITSILYTKVDDPAVRGLLHDWGGYTMMPVALAVVVGELWLLTRLTTAPTEIEPAVISRQQPQHVPDP